MSTLIFLILCLAACAARRAYPHVSTLAGRKVWSKKVEIPTSGKRRTASNNAEFLSAANDKSTIVILVDGNIGSVTLSPAHSTDALRYVVFVSGGRLSAVNFNGARNWRFTTDQQTLQLVEFSATTGRNVRFYDAENCIVERAYYRGAHNTGRTFAVWDSSDSGVTTDCGVQRFFHETVSDKIAQQDFVLFGIIGHTNPKRRVRTKNCFIYDARSRNPGDFFQSTSEDPGKWNNGVDHVGFHIAGIETWTDLYDANGLALSAENAFDLKCGSSDPSNPVIIEDFRAYGYRKGAGGSVRDHGTAIVVHIDRPQNIIFRDALVWDSARGVSFLPGNRDANGGGNLVSDNVVYHSIHAFGAVLYNSGGGGNKIVNNHFVDNDVVFSSAQHNNANGFTIEGNIIDLAKSAGSLDKSTSRNNLSNKPFRGASTDGAAGRASRLKPIVIEMPNPNDIRSATGVKVTLQNVLVDPSDAPDDFIWVVGNEAPPFAGAAPALSFDLPDSLELQAEQPKSLQLNPAGGKSPYKWSVKQSNEEVAVSFNGDSIRFQRSSTKADSLIIDVEVTVTDAEDKSATNVVRVLSSPCKWTANSEPNADAVAHNVADSRVDGDDLSGWIGSTKDGPAILTCTLDSPLDITHVRTVEFLDHERTYTRQWEAKHAESAEWKKIAQFGDQTMMQTKEFTWVETAVSLTNVVAIRRVGTANSQGSEWQRVTEVEFKGKKHVPRTSVQMMSTKPLTQTKTTSTNAMKRAETTTAAGASCVKGTTGCECADSGACTTPGTTCIAAKCVSASLYFCKDVRCKCASDAECNSGLKCVAERCAYKSDSACNQGSIGCNCFSDDTCLTKDLTCNADKVCIEKEICVPGLLGCDCDSKGICQQTGASCVVLQDQQVCVQAEQPIAAVEPNSASLIALNASLALVICMLLK